MIRILGKVRFSTTKQELEGRLSSEFGAVMGDPQVPCAAKAADGDLRALLKPLIFL